MRRDEDHVLSIGELSRASGLGVSALRFYDREGVLVPADVDGVTGYRRYSPDQVRSARLLAGMRRIQVPVAEMVAVLEAGADADLAEDLLEGHLARLERGLRDARREVERLRHLVRGTDSTTTFRLHGPTLTAALASVRHAVGSDPDLPVLAGVLLDRDETGLRAVATDRYRLALAPVTGAEAGPRSSVLLPVDLVDRLLRVAPTGEVVLTERASVLTLTAPDLALEAPSAAGDYPDYRALLPEGPATPASAVRLELGDLRAGVGALRDQARVRVLRSGQVLDADAGRPGEDRGRDSSEVLDAEPTEVLVDAAFLWDALSMTDDGYLVLPGAGALGPLAVHAGDDSLLALVMPLRQEERT